jgi:hypothetical protein
MSELTREIIPIVVMYLFVLALAPFIGFAMWVAFDGDRLVEPEVDAAGAAEPTTAATPAHQEPQIKLEAPEALGAA